MEGGPVTSHRGCWGGGLALGELLCVWEEMEGGYGVVRNMRTSCADLDLVQGIGRYGEVEMVGNEDKRREYSTRGPHPCLPHPDPSKLKQANSKPSNIPHLPSALFLFLFRELNLLRTPPPHPLLTPPPHSTPAIPKAALPMVCILYVIQDRHAHYLGSSPR